MSLSFRRCFGSAQKSVLFSFWTYQMRYAIFMRRTFSISAPPFLLTSSRNLTLLCLVFSTLSIFSIWWFSYSFTSIYRIYVDFEWFYFRYINWFVSINVLHLYGQKWQTHEGHRQKQKIERDNNNKKPTPTSSTISFVHTTKLCNIAFGYKWHSNFTITHSSCSYASFELIW